MGELLEGGRYRHWSEVFSLYQVRWPARDIERLLSPHPLSIAVLYVNLQSATLPSSVLSGYYLFIDAGMQSAICGLCACSSTCCNCLLRLDNVSQLRQLSLKVTALASSSYHLVYSTAEHQKNQDRQRQLPIVQVLSACSRSLCLPVLEVSVSVVSNLHERLNARHLCCARERSATAEQ